MKEKGLAHSSPGDSSVAGFGDDVAVHPVVVRAHELEPSPGTAKVACALSPGSIVPVLMSRLSIARSCGIESSLATSTVTSSPAAALSTPGTKAESSITILMASPGAGPLPTSPAGSESAGDGASHKPAARSG